MKKKLQKDIFRIGTKNVDIDNLRLVETLSISIVGVLSLTIGIIFGSAILA